MPSLRDTIFVAVALGLVAATADPASTQPLNRLPPARAPCSLGRACHPSFCGLGHKGPCFPQYGPPIGENPQLTIVSTNTGIAGEAENSTDAGKAGKTGEAAKQEPLDSIGGMFAALRACWVPPPKNEARHGMEYTIRFAFKRDGSLVAPPFVTYASHDVPAETRAAYRDAVDAALKRCMPLQFSNDMAEAITGLPIAVRFVDDRNNGDAKSLQ
jgi:hypothetical protein